jgi:hypothetical protein
MDFEPFLPRPTGLPPVRTPFPLGRGGVEDPPRPIQLAPGTEPIEHLPVQLVEHPGLDPYCEKGDARSGPTDPERRRQIPPRVAADEHVDRRGKYRPAIEHQSQFTTQTTGYRNALSPANLSPRYGVINEPSRQIHEGVLTASSTMPGSSSGCRELQEWSVVASKSFEHFPRPVFTDRTACVR